MTDPTTPTSTSAPQDAAADGSRSVLRGFATISYWTDDQAASSRWYADLLGVEPYFVRDGYAEFRIGDDQDELGIIDRRFAPPGLPTEPGGAVMHWHVDDLEGTYADLLARGATPFQPPRSRGEGFVTASVVDPFGNVLGFMFNPHYVELLAARTAAGAGTDAASGR